MTRAKQIARRTERAHVTTSKHAELQRLFWDAAVTRKLRATAIAEQRFEAVNRYERHLEDIAREHSALEA